MARATQTSNSSAPKKSTVKKLAVKNPAPNKSEPKKAGTSKAMAAATTGTGGATTATTATTAATPSRRSGKAAAPTKADGPSAGKKSAKASGKAEGKRAGKATEKVTGKAASLISPANAAGPDLVPAAASPAPTKPHHSSADAKPNGEADKGKPRKPKLVRDSFTMPEEEYRALGDIKKACLKAGFEVKKSQLLRAGIAMLKQTSPADLKIRLAALTPLKTGRPSKEK